MRKIGINLSESSPWSDEEYIAAAAEAGFGAIFTGVLEEKRQMRCAELLARAGIEYETLHAPFIGINTIWQEGDAGEEMLSRLKACVDRCVKVGARITVVHLSSGVNAPTITDIGRERFARFVSYAAQNNVKIAFENQRKLANLAWAMETFGPEDSVGFCWDCGHENCLSPGIEYMPLFGKRIICTHIHDNVGIFDQDDHMLPFEGKIDYSRFAGHIRKSGYEGSLMLEINCKHYVDLSAKEYLSRAASAVKRLVAMVDA